MAEARKPAASKAKPAEKDDEDVSRMENEGGPDPEAEKQKRAQADERVKRAEESKELETRDKPRGFHADPLLGDYTVEQELRNQWPGIELGDVKE